MCCMIRGCTAVQHCALLTVVVLFTPNSHSHTAQTFNMLQSSAVTLNATISFTAMDGAAIYLNGVLIESVNLPALPLAISSLALSCLPSSAQTSVTTFTLPAGALLPGDNVIAAEVHRYDLRRWLSSPFAGRSHARKSYCDAYLACESPQRDPHSATHTQTRSRSHTPPRTHSHTATHIRTHTHSHTHTTHTQPHTYKQCQAYTCTHSLVCAGAPHSPALLCGIWRLTLRWRQRRRPPLSPQPPHKPSPLEVRCVH